MVSARLLVTSLFSAALTSAQFYSNSSSLSSFSSVPPSSSLLPSNSSSIVPSSSSSTAPEETPFITGSFVDGSLQWEIFVPGSLGPWTEVSVAAEGQDFTIQEVTVLVGNSPAEANIANGGSSFTAGTGEQAEDGEYLSFRYVASRNTNARQFTTNAILSITTPDDRKLIKRAVVTYDFTSTITIPDEASSITSGSDSATATSTDSETTIWGTSVVTETISGVVTSYTTYCPISTVTDDQRSTTVVTITSCTADHPCSEGGEGYTTVTKTIIKNPGEGEGTTVSATLPIATLTLGGDEGSEGPVTGGGVITTTNAEGTTVVIVYKTSTTGEGEASTTGGGEGETSASVTTFEGVGNKLATGAGLLLPALVFLF